MSMLGAERLFCYCQRALVELPRSAKVALLMHQQVIAGIVTLPRDGRQDVLEHVVGCLDRSPNLVDGDDRVEGGGHRV